MSSALSMSVSDSAKSFLTHISSSGKRIDQLCFRQGKHVEIIIVIKEIKERVLIQFIYHFQCLYIVVSCPPGSFSWDSNPGCSFLQYFPSTKSVGSNQNSNTRDHCDGIGSHIPVIRTSEEGTSFLNKINSLLVRKYICINFVFVTNSYIMCYVKLSKAFLL